MTHKAENIFMALLTLFCRFTDAMEETFCPVLGGYFLSLMGVLFFTAYCLVTVSNVISAEYAINW
jgi:hypothetical protein